MDRPMYAAVALAFLIGAFIFGGILFAIYQEDGWKGPAVVLGVIVASPFLYLGLEWFGYYVREILGWFMHEFRRFMQDNSPDQDEEAETMEWE